MLGVETELVGLLVTAEREDEVPALEVLTGERWKEIMTQWDPGLGRGRQASDREGLTGALRNAGIAPELRKPEVNREGRSQQGPWWFHRIPGFLAQGEAHSMR